MSEKVIIVRNASKDAWKHYWSYDPTQTPLLPIYSCHTTEAGIQNGIKPYYNDREEAERDCQKLNQNVKLGNFGVCPMKSVQVMEPA